MNAILRTFLLALVMLSGQQPPSVQEAIDRMRATLDQLEKDAHPPEPPKPVIISTPEAFDAARVAAKPGDVLTLASGFVYNNAVTLSTAITIQGETLPEGRVDRAAALPSFRGGLEVTGDDVILRAIEVRHTNPLTHIIRVSGKHVLIDRVRVLGDPEKGARRGIIANGGAGAVLVRSYVADCFQVFPGNDSQAVVAWDMLPGFLIDDSYLEGGSETVMLGGADSSDDAHTPDGIVIRNSTLTKNPAWKALPRTVKNILEIKNARHVLVEGNTLSQSWGKAAGNGGGQDGCAIVINVRNQDGRCPWCTIEDVTLRNNTIANAAAGINILGTDNRPGFPSQRMARVSLTANKFDLDAVSYYGGLVPKMILLMGGADDLTIDNNQFAGVGLYTAVHFENGTYERLSIKGNSMPKTRYQWFGAVVGSSLPKILAKFVTSGELAPNVVQ